MTITLEQDPLIPLVGSHCKSSDIFEGFVFVDGGDWCLLRQCANDETDTVSTTSLSDSSDSECERRVSFVDKLITEVWTRPYTSHDDIKDLYYSVEDIAR